MAPEFSEFTLQLRRLAAADNCVELKSGDKWVKVSGPLPGPLHVGVSRSSADEPANLPYYRRTTPSPVPAARRVRRLSSPSQSGKPSVRSRTEK